MPLPWARPVSLRDTSGQLCTMQVLSSELALDGRMAASMRPQPGTGSVLPWAALTWAHILLALHHPTVPSTQALGLLVTLRTQLLLGGVGARASEAWQQILTLNLSGCHQDTGLNCGCQLHPPQSLESEAVLGCWAWRNGLLRVQAKPGAASKVWMETGPPEGGRL